MSVVRPGPDLIRLQEETRNEGSAVLPVGSAGLIGLYDPPAGLAKVTAWPIVCNTSPITDPDLVVEFRNQRMELGTRMIDLLGEKSECLKGGDDLVLQKLQGKDAQFLITWIGYENRPVTINTKDQNGAPITRLNLATQITKAYAEFFNEIEIERVLPYGPGFYNISLHQGSSKRKDSLGIQFTQLRLARCYKMTRGFFVAEIDIDI